jgi:hypothetical protein
MYNFILMCKINRVNNLPKEVTNLLLIELIRFLKNSVHIPISRIFHYYTQKIPLVKNIIDTDYIGVFELLKDLYLVQTAVIVFVYVYFFLGNLFYGHPV